MKKILTVGIIALLIVSCKPESEKIFFNHNFNPQLGMVSEHEQAFREELCLNGKWQFMPVFENDINQFIKPENFIWDDVQIKIPSPWNVNGFPQSVSSTFDKKDDAKIEGGDFNVFPSYPKEWEKAEIAWMRKEFSLPENFEDKEMVLHFEAIAGYAKIYINGELLSENLEIFFPTEIVVSPYIKEGKNEIIIGVAKASLTDDPGKFGRRNYVAGSFWGRKIAGIWQDVYLFAYPTVYTSNVFVKPDVANNSLEIELEISNTSGEDVEISAGASIQPWINLAGKSAIEAPVEKGKLGDIVAEIEFSENLMIPSGSKATITLHKKINNELDYWTPETPNLYGVIVQLKQENEVIDHAYERFGWRQFSIDGKQLLLNGKPIVLKGDSWHFMGIPQMTRRYAWAWYQMLRDANANAVRLHAQPFPRFYLDMADEMGICVLDETAIWSSDGGPKMDSEDYWVYCQNHVKELVMRDRNHPSVFGWSVCNETLPVAIHVFHAPDSIVQRQIDEINNWVKIVKDNDPTRDWISGDGETMRPTDLPTIIGHYGGTDGMNDWSSRDMPWGIGEQGKGYYGTPKQVSVHNGDRAYESMLGRTEGLAIEAYDLITTQLELKASYASVFNVVWYGLQPLELGLNDLTRLSTNEDGIHFGEYVEGITGVQPERLGPYSTTLNPGYDKTLPLYKPWPLFNAVKAAFSTPIKDFSIEREERALPEPGTDIFSKVILISEKPDEFKKAFDKMGIPFIDSKEVSKETLVIIDGNNPPSGDESKIIIDETLQTGGLVFTIGGSPESVERLNHLLPYKIEFTTRKATSFVIKNPDILIGNLGNKDLYFTEVIKQPVMSHGISGAIAKKGSVILEACNTDWSVWNYRPEFLKTASVTRSEREAKEAGAALIKLEHQRGSIYVLSIDFTLLKTDGKQLLKEMLSNLGLEFDVVDMSDVKAFNEEFRLTNALLCGSFFTHGLELEQVANIDSIDESNIKPKFGQKTLDYSWELVKTDLSGALDFKNLNIKGNLESGVAFLSFWIYSPRSLINLLAEPDMPGVDMVIGADDGFQLILNGKEIYRDTERGGYNPEEYIIKKIPFDKGWNHILIKCLQAGGDWKFGAYLKSDTEGFLEQLDSAIEN